MPTSNALTPSFSLPRDKRQSFALMFHFVTEMYGSGYSGVTISRHPVLSCDGKPHVGAGSPFATSDLAQLTAILSDTQDDESLLLPPNLLGRSNAHLCWYVPGKVRPMWFATDKGTQRLDVPWPNLIFLVKDGRLSITAYEGSKRPDASTRLYHAPLSNIYRDTGVCIGSATVPASMDIKTMAGWESVIFDTRFSHVNHDATLALKARGRPVKSVSTVQHVAFWKKLARETAKAKGGRVKFPAEQLVSLGTTLSRYLISAR
jgi:PRTRC genetic system protein B